jgi:NAD(P)-dependent dehydrogenase (short-subunit alcohol dehydrogenase family)
LALESLAGKVAVVTGGGSGIGQAIVTGLTAAGATCHAISRHGPVALDVTDRAAVKRFVDSLERVDILVCAAGDNVPRRRLEELTPEAWDHLLAVNLSGAFYFLSAALGKLRAARGDVVFISSVSAQWPDPSGPAYQAGKAGLNALARAAGFEEHQNGLRFSVINPGATDTALLSKRPVPPPAAAREAMLRPEDVAESCLLMLRLPKSAHIPELTILPTRIQALGKTAGLEAGPS